MLKRLLIGSGLVMLLSFSTGCCGFWERMCSPAPRAVLHSVFLSRFLPGAAASSVTRTAVPQLLIRTRNRPTDNAFVG